MKTLSWQRAQENMCVDGSQAVVQLRGALKRGFLAKKGISSACDRLRPPATACDRGHPLCVCPIIVRPSAHGRCKMGRSCSHARTLDLLGANGLLCLIRARHSNNLVDMHCMHHKPTEKWGSAILACSAQIRQQDYGPTVGAPNLCILGGCNFGPQGVRCL